jgi:hypothetical protein
MHHKPSYNVGKDGRVVPTDAYGNKRYDKPQYKVKDGKVYETEAYRRVKQQKFRNQGRTATSEVRSWATLSSSDPDRA